MLIFYLDLEISRKKPYFMFNSLKWRNFGWIPVISKVVESFLIPKLKTNKMSTTRRASILTRQGRHLIIYRVEGSQIMAHLNHHFSAVMYTYVLSIVRLISTNGQLSLDPRPDGGRSTFLLADGPPSRSTIKGRWGLGHKTWDSPQPPAPLWCPNPSPI